VNGIRIHLARLSAAQIIESTSIAAIALVALAATIVLSKYRRLGSALITITLMAAPLGALIAINIVVALYKLVPRPADFLVYDRRLVPLLPTRSDQHRVVVIVFDRWDYQESFERRLPGWRTADLDRLVAESFVATNAVRAGWRTLTAMPAILSGRQSYNALPAWTMGRPEAEAHVARGVDLAIAFADSDRRELWSDQPNLFREARRRGLNVAYAGAGYHPYCSLFHDAISGCYGGGYKPETAYKTVVSQLDNVLGEALIDFPGARRFLEVDEPRLHPIPLADDYLRTLEALRRFARAPAYSLVFAHFFVPHHLFYDPAKHEFAPPESLGDLSDSQRFRTVYQAHLELINRVVRELRIDLENSGLSSRTTVILSSDHGLHKLGASRSHMRVPLIVKPPHPLPPMVSSEQLRVANLLRLVLGMLDGRVSSNQEIVTLLRPTGAQLAP
jgi:hypothetical protein